MNQQLELSLWNTLQSVQMTPEQMNLGELLVQVEEAIAQVPEAEQLRLAGEMLLRVTDLYAKRAEVLITEWEDSYRDPVVEQGFFAELVRQTMAVDLEELMEPLPPRKPRAKQSKATKAEEGSIAAPVEKETLLAMVDKLEAEAQDLSQQNVLAIAHDEDVSRWVAAIAQWLQDAPDPQVSFTELCRYLGMPLVKTWLGLLLGGFELEQQGEFYQSTIWVKCPASNPYSIL